MNRKSHWENVYATKSPLEVSWYQAEPVTSLKLIHNTAVAKDTPIIDVGGGASLLVDRLLDAGYEKLAVLDISSTALEHTKKRLGEAAKRIEWHETDVTEFAPPHKYGLWHDRAVFHFLTDAGDRQRYADAARASLLPRGHLIIGAFAVGGPTKCSGLDIVQYEAQAIKIVFGADFDLLEEVSEQHLTPAGGTQQFNFFRLRKRD